MGTGVSGGAVPAMYESFDRFLQDAIREYYERSGRRQRGDFVALLVASGEIAPVAADAVRKAPAKHLAAGAAAAIALRIGLRFALSGPLAVLVGGLTVASLLAYLYRHQGSVLSRVRLFREAILEVHVEYDRIQDVHADGGYTDDERALMIDGLTQRLMRELDDRSRRADEESGESGKSDDSGETGETGESAG